MAGGAVVWITGIPAAGKTTLAFASCEALRAAGREADVLDGDELRASSSRDLGFGPAARAENARRATALALGHARRGAVALVALVSPYREDRDAARASVLADGHPFVEVFLDTGLAECRRRDPKGLYAAAMAGRVVGLTGWDAPYEPPRAPEVHLTPPPHARALALEEGVARVLAALAA